MEYLILGNGLVGGELQKRTGWDCIARSTNGFDIRDPDRFDVYLRGYKTIINCIGYVKDYYNRDMNWVTNWQAVIDLVDWCNINKVKFVHMSSDCVYRGRKPYAKESDVPVHAENWYAYSKLLADGYVQARSNHYLMVRMALKGKPFPYDAVSDRVGNFDYVDRIVDIIVKLIEAGASGVFNIGTDPKSMLHLARLTKPTIETDGKPVIDMTMNLDKMKGALCKMQF